MPVLCHYSFFPPAPPAPLNVVQLKYWQDILTTSAVMAIGAIFIPYFALGLAIGLFYVSFIKPLIRALVLMVMEPNETAQAKEVRENILLATLIGPVLEEVLFRGLLQPVLLFGMASLFPQLAGLAAVIAVLIAGVAFGLAHLGNKHPNSHIQAALCVFSGIFYGIVALQFGLGASIAIHMLNNTLLTAMRLLPRPSTDLEAAHRENMAYGL